MGYDRPLPGGRKMPFLVMRRTYMLGAQLVLEKRLQLKDPYANSERFVAAAVAFPVMIGAAGSNVDRPSVAGSSQAWSAITPGAARLTPARRAATVIFLTARLPRNRSAD